METFQLLKNLAGIHHKTILISSHDINLAIETSDKLLLMTKEGLFVGKPLELIENGNIKKLFTSNTIEFNTSKKRFVLKN
jgi:iron complex transport system ATP-binding protein